MRRAASSFILSPSPCAHMLNMTTETTSMKFVMKSVGLAGRKLVGSHASDSRMNVVHDTKMVTITTTEISLAQAGFSLKSGSSKVWKTFHRKEPMYFGPAAGSRGSFMMQAETAVAVARATDCVVLLATSSTCWRK